MKLSKSGLVLCLIYSALFLAAGLFALYLLVFQTAQSEFSGLLAIIVTLPWSLISFPIFSALGYTAWYSQFSNTPLIYGLFALLGVVPSALINILILYFFGRLFDRRSQRPAL